MTVQPLRDTLGNRDPVPHTRLQFLGPQLHPIGKWIFALVYLVVWTLVMAVGVTRGFPLWLRLAGFAAWGLFLIAFSIWILYLRANRRARHEWLRRGPRGYWQWFLDDYYRDRKAAGEKNIALHPDKID